MEGNAAASPAQASTPDHILVDLPGLAATIGIDEPTVQRMVAEAGGDMAAVAQQLFAQGAKLVKGILKPVGERVVLGGGNRVRALCCAAWPRSKYLC
jgi:hypothetical protein